MLPPPSGNFTKLYNDYIDEYLYLMTPYEVVVLLFVLRHTHGFQRASAKFSYSVIRDGFLIQRNGGDDDAFYIPVYGFRRYSAVSSRSHMPLHGKNLEFQLYVFWGEQEDKLVYISA